MLSFFFVSALSSCSLKIEQFDNFAVQKLTIKKGQTVCLNISVLNYHIFFTEATNSDFKIASYDPIKHAFQRYTINSNNLSQPLFSNFENFLNINITTDLEEDNLTFIGVHFTTPCYNGIFFSSLPNDKILFSKSFQNISQLKNYDDKCVVLYGYEDSLFGITYSIDEGDELTIYRNNSIEKSKKGVQELFFEGESIALHFESDFSIVSDYINISTQSQAYQSKIAASGYRLFDRSSSTADPTPGDINKMPGLDTPILVVIVVIAILVIIVVAVLLVYCLVFNKPKNEEGEAPTISENVPPLEIEQNLVP